MDAPRARARDLGIAPGRHEPGRRNAITDVAGVRVGQLTLRDGDSIRTGVTAIVPDAVDRAGGTLPAGLFVGNGFGKLVGATQLVELGQIETPIVLTGTLSAFRAADALVSYMIRLPGNENLRSVNPVVGETNDGYLSDIRARPVTGEHVLAAISRASDGAVEEGSVGAGTGTAALGFKAGIGTASRMFTFADGRPGVLGVLAQANFGGTLLVLGVPMDRDGALAGLPISAAEPAGNSCMIVLAIDLPLDSRQLSRIARRAVFALGRVGSDFAGGSGDYAIAFSTGAGSAPAAGPRSAWAAPVPDNELEPAFAAAQEAVEEALLNSLFMAITTAGYQGHIAHAVPLDFVTSRLALWPFA